MENFGIFNILSSLKSIIDTNNKATEQQQQKENPSKSEGLNSNLKEVAPEKINKSEKTNKNDTDNFILPEIPKYQRMLEVMERHDNISKNIDKHLSKK